MPWLPMEGCPCAQQQGAKPRAHVVEAPQPLGSSIGRVEICGSPQPRGDVVVGAAFRDRLGGHDSQKAPLIGFGQQQELRPLADRALPIRLIAEHLPFRQRHDRFAALFPNLTNAFLVVVDGPTPARAGSAAEALAARLAAQPERFHDVYLPGAGPFFAHDFLDEIFRCNEERVDERRRTCCGRHRARDPNAAPFPPADTRRELIAHHLELATTNQDGVEVLTGAATAAAG